MSNTHNTEWYEAASENFQEAVSQGNFDQAKAVVDDIADAGFMTEAVAMWPTLNNMRKQSVTSYREMRAEVEHDRMESVNDNYLSSRYD